MHLSIFSKFYANLGEVKIGPFTMIHAFKVLYKCDSVSYNDALDIVTIFVVNTSEAIRDEEIYKEIENSFDMFLDKVDSKWNQN